MSPPRSRRTVYWRPFWLVTPSSTASPITVSDHRADECRHRALSVPPPIYEPADAARDRTGRRTDARARALDRHLAGIDDHAVFDRRGAAGRVARNGVAAADLAGGAGAHGDGDDERRARGDGENARNRNVLFLSRHASRSYAPLCGSVKLTPAERGIAASPIRPATKIRPFRLVRRRSRAEPQESATRGVRRRTEAGRIGGENAAPWSGRERPRSGAASSASREQTATRTPPGFSMTKAPSSNCAAVAALRHRAPRSPDPGSSGWRRMVPVALHGASRHGIDWRFGSPDATVGGDALGGKAGAGEVRGEPLQPGGRGIDCDHPPRRRRGTASSCCRPARRRDRRWSCRRRPAHPAAAGRGSRRRRPPNHQAPSAKPGRVSTAPGARAASVPGRISAAERGAQLAASTGGSRSVRSSGRGRPCGGDGVRRLLAIGRAQRRHSQSGVSARGLSIMRQAASPRRRRGAARR